jgi:SAM-dependent methyltransferase
MQIDPRDKTFITGQLPSVEGWLIDDAAYLTSTLMRLQTKTGVTGSIFEIGVFAGKYLSLLYHLSADKRDRVLGLDTFEWYPKAKVETKFATLFGKPARLTLQTGDSTKATPGDLLSILGSPARFISVDGAHTSAAVLHDLNLAERLLAPGGIVAIDDFLNPRAIGVSEGAYRYFLTREGRGLIPFAFCANKLFAAAPADAARFSKQTFQFADKNPTLSMSAEFKRLLSQGRHWVELELLGHPVLVF